jgi:hypothetical protein
MNMDMKVNMVMNKDINMVIVRYHSGGSAKLNACILILVHMVYL